MLTVKQLRKLDRCPSDKSIVGYGRVVDCGDWWSNTYIALHEQLPKGVEPERSTDINPILESVVGNQRQVWPTRIQPGHPKTMTRLDGKTGAPVWVNTKYLLAVAKKGRNAETFWANENGTNPIVSKDASGNDVAIIMPLFSTSYNNVGDNDPDWWLQNTDLPGHPGTPRIIATWDGAYAPAPI